jgi:hypothetical protein
VNFMRQKYNIPAPDQDEEIMKPAQTADPVQPPKPEDGPPDPLESKSAKPSPPIDPEANLLTQAEQIARLLVKALEADPDLEEEKTKKTAAQK